MQKVIAKVGFTRHVVNEFEKDVNALLEQGFHLDLFEVEKGLFRILCTAILCDEDHYDDEEGSYDSSDDEEDDNEK